MPYTVGNVSKSVFLNGPESHKLMLEFAVASDSGIEVGQPCKMHADGGKVVACASGDAENLMVGVSIHPGFSAYGDHIVLACRGYAVIYAQSGAAVTPGPVQYNGYDASTKYNKVIDLADVATPAENANLPASLHMGWALDAAADAGEIIRVLVKD